MNVKKVIKEKGFTIEKVAELLEVNRVGLTRSLDNNPTVGTLRRVAEAIGCKVGDFFLDEIVTIAPAGTITIEGKEYDVILRKKHEH